jgi:hypothetical protein
MRMWIGMAGAAIVAATVSTGATWAFATRKPEQAASEVVGTNGPPLTMTVAGLQAICEVNGPDPQSWCAAYLMAAADTLQAFGGGGHKAGTCADSYRIEQLAPIFTGWARRNPQAADLPMLAGVNLAFREAWPCT